MLGKWENDALQDSAGNAIVVSGATVEVRFQSTGTLVGATGLFEDAGGVTPLGNPFVVSGSIIKFYAFSSDRYRVKITKGALERILEDEAVSTPPISDYIATLLTAVDAATARATLAAAGTGVANTFTANQTISKATPVFILNGTGGTDALLRYQDDGVSEWDIGRIESDNSYRVIENGVSNRLIILPGGAATYTGNWGITGLLDISNAASGQIKFPATENPSGDPNTLTDFEKGTWVESVGGTATYIVQTGKYTKIGNVVHLMADLRINVIGTGSTSQITGAPFVNNGSVQGSLAIGQNGNIATAVVSLAAVIFVGSTTIQIRARTAASVNDSVPPIFGNGTTMFFSGIYLT